MQGTEQFYSKQLNSLLEPKMKDQAFQPTYRIASTNPPPSVGTDTTNSFAEQPSSSTWIQPGQSQSNNENAVLEQSQPISYQKPPIIYNPQSHAQQSSFMKFFAQVEEDEELHVSSEQQEQFQQQQQNNGRTNAAYQLFPQNPSAKATASAANHMEKSEMIINNNSLVNQSSNSFPAAVTDVYVKSASLSSSSSSSSSIITPSLSLPHPTASTTIATPFNPQSPPEFYQPSKQQQQRIHTNQAVHSQVEDFSTSSSSSGQKKSMQGHYTIDQAYVNKDFKVYECSKKEKHEKKKCPNYHNDEDRRRCPASFTYSFNLCDRGGKCNLKDDCPQVHNKVEQLYHPLRYKTKFCKSFKLSNKCDYGVYCSFAHQESDIVIPIIARLPRNPIYYMYFYKTVWCPDTLTHERGSCPYIHNVQDLRRDPKNFRTEPKQCEAWSTSISKMYSQGGCADELNCKNCHGWKEYNYHPMVYKTKPCDKENCDDHLECVLYHSDADKRVVTPALLRKEESIAADLLRNVLHTHSDGNVLLGAPINVFFSDYERDTSFTNQNRNGAHQIPQNNRNNNNNRINNQSQQQQYSQQQNSVGQQQQQQQQQQPQKQNYQTNPSNSFNNNNNNHSHNSSEQQSHTHSRTQNQTNQRNPQSNSHTNEVQFESSSYHKNNSNNSYNNNSNNNYSNNQKGYQNNNNNNNNHSTYVTQNYQPEYSNHQNNKQNNYNNNNNNNYIPNHSNQRHSNNNNNNFGNNNNNNHIHQQQNQSNSNSSKGNHSSQQNNRQYIPKSQVGQQYIYTQKQKPAANTQSMELSKSNSDPTATNITTKSNQQPKYVQVQQQDQINQVKAPSPATTTTTIGLVQKNISQPAESSTYSINSGSSSSSSSNHGSSIKKIFSNTSSSLPASSPLTSFYPTNPQLQSQQQQQPMPQQQIFTQTNALPSPVISSFSIQPSQTLQQQQQQQLNGNLQASLFKHMPEFNELNLINHHHHTHHPHQQQQQQQHHQFLSQTNSIRGVNENTANNCDDSQQQQQQLSGQSYNQLYSDLSPTDIGMKDDIMPTLSSILFSSTTTTTNSSPAVGMIINPLSTTNGTAVAVGCNPLNGSNGSSGGSTVSRKNSYFDESRKSSISISESHRKNSHSEFQKMFDQNKQQKIFTLLLANNYPEEAIKNLSFEQIKQMNFLTNVQKDCLGQIIMNFRDDQDIQNLYNNLDLNDTL